MMKGGKLLLGLAILGGSLILSVTGCKKGPNDPFISLKSRDGRIKGTWKLSKVEYRYKRIVTDPDLTCSPDVTATSIISDDGTNFTRYDTSTRYDFINGTCVTETDMLPFTGSFEFTVNKDGSYTYSSAAGVERTEGQGYWHWNDSRKNKLFVVFDYNWFSCSLNGFDEDNATNIIGGQWLVDRLSSKELILVSECKNSYVDGNRQVEETVIVKLTFTKQK